MSSRLKRHSFVLSDDGRIFQVTLLPPPFPFIVFNWVPAIPTEYLNIWYQILLPVWISLEPVAILSSVIISDQWERTAKYKVRWQQQWSPRRLLSPLSRSEGGGGGEVWIVTIESTLLRSVIHTAGSNSFSSKQIYETCSYFSPNYNDLFLKRAYF